METTFREREVFLRTDGKVRYFTVSARLQKLVCLAASSAIVVPLTMAVGSAVYHSGLSAENDSLRAYRQAYVALLAETGSYQEEFARQVTREDAGGEQGALDQALSAREALRDRWQAIRAEGLVLAESDPAIAAELARIDELLAAHEGERRDLAAAEQRLGLRLERSQVDLARLEAEASALAVQRDALERDLGLSEQARHELITSTKRLALQLNDLEDAVAVAAAEKTSLEHRIVGLEGDLGEAETKVEQVAKQRDFYRIRSGNPGNPIGGNRRGPGSYRRAAEREYLGLHFLDRAGADDHRPRYR